MASLKIERVLELPNPLSANTMYMVADDNETFLHFVATGNTAEVVYRSIDQNDISTYIATALAGLPPGNSGTVTSVAVTVPAGMEVENSPITTNGTLIFKYAAGYSIPTNSKQGQWDTAYGWGNHTEAGYYKTGEALDSPASGNLANCTVDGTNKIGYRNIPQNLQPATYTCALTDDGKHIYLTGAAGNNTATIPANATVAFPIGAAITFVAGASQAIIAITTDVMRLAGVGTTGTRTLAAYGVATAIKISATEWRISGAGLS